MKVLCIGHASYDISLPVKSYPVENTKYRLEEKIECGGGPACTAAYLLGKWGVNTYYQGVVGNDVYGKRLISELKEVGVNTKYVHISEKEDTSLSFILINQKNASRTLFNCGVKKEKPKETEYNFKPDIIHIDGQYPELSKKVFKKYSDAIKVIDAGRITDALLELCTMVDYLVCSKGFAETVTKTRIDFKNKETLKTVFLKLEKKYPNAQIVVTLEEKGCMFKLNDKVKWMTGLKVKELDTTGAGDIFHGAFIFALTQNVSIEKACKIANITGGLSVKEIGTRASVPSLRKVYEIYKTNK